MSIRIGSREVGPGQPTLIVGEMSVNHDGDPIKALEMVRELKRCGADACKIQLFRAEEFCTDAAEYRGEKQVDLFKRYELSRETARAIKEECDRQGLIFFGTPGDIESARFLVKELGAPAVKIGSDDIVHHKLLRSVAKLGVPVILSTGMAMGGEVWQAIQACGLARVILMHCVSEYPTPEGHANLRRMASLREAVFPSVPVMGYSDHTDGIMAAIVSVAMGARIVEKHFTLDRSGSGPDHAFSAAPSMFAAMVRQIREVEELMGSGQIDPGPAELEMRKLARRSIVAARDLPRGLLLVASDLAYKRPGTGLLPQDATMLHGRSLLRDVAKDEQIRAEDVGLVRRGIGFRVDCPPRNQPEMEDRR